ncbi:MAG: PEP-CTERM sorting domain-containing protein [Tsuneonella suprasediminis]|uniref:PEP-CTERM sorting domain-containing protein n=1 Tax=Tsuneonella suprasediminis TaxID=2306996 RepID=A0A419R0N8_9SPHN|nr:PEP-CTERM sorting domain-containing protein [Tsuneonella suprasediminis]RJX67033.1 PEP-CTERM sorting domain-containing protein [Tsuneonella suprasediminis]UBS32129.1 PEP-CTERM sorting domain-containing protein [Altererythrobacter sp. N1]
MRLARNLLAGLALATVAAPALAMTTPPTEPGTGSSSGGSGSSGGTAVPEPGMFGIMGLALAGVVIARRRRKS